MLSVQCVLCDRTFSNISVRLQGILEDNLAISDLLPCPALWFLLKMGFSCNTAMETKFRSRGDEVLSARMQFTQQQFSC